MDDVTDTVFRQIVGQCAAPDIYFTEFVNVDALQSPGRQAALKRLKFTATEKPLVAQLWGLKPENFYKTAKEIADGSLAAEANQGDEKASGINFDGVDLNFGCPEKNVVRNGACSAMINNRPLAGEVIQATREGLKTKTSSLPLSVKTRLGFNEIDFSWPEFLLKQKLNMLSIHGRTRKQMSNVPADWSSIARIRELRDALCPATLIVGNGDVETRLQGEALAKEHGLDGIMIGRGIFGDPFVFSTNSPWASYTPEQRMALYKRHVELFAATWPAGSRKVYTLNKFCKTYIQSFDGAKELREKLMAAASTDELQSLLEPKIALK